MPTLRAVPPAADHLAHTVLDTALPAGMHLLTFHDGAPITVTSDRLDPADLIHHGLPLLLGARATRLAHRPHQRGRIVGYGVTDTATGNALCLGRHGDHVHLTRTDATPPWHADRVGVLLGLHHLMMAGPGRYDPPAVPAPATAAVTGRHGVPCAPVLPGQPAIFAPSWTITEDRYGNWFARTGFTGQLLQPTADDEWTISLSPAVADALVGDHQRHRATVATRIREAGYRDHLADARLARSVTDIGWRDQTIVIDSRALHGNDGAVTVIDPHDGRYPITGIHLTPVLAAACEQVITDPALTA